MNQAMGKQKSCPNILAMGGEVVWSMPNNTYLRMPPAAALNLAAELMRAVGQATSNAAWAGNLAKQRRPKR